MKSICVIGIGYVGLPTAAMFASKGHRVVGYDLNERAVNALNKGEIIIEEPGLGDLVKDVVAKGFLTATTTCPDDCDVYIIAVPTPINPDKTADMRFVESATRAVVPCVRKGCIVILESTSPPRTVEDLMLPILKETGLEIGEELLVAHSPERILPGKVIEELRTNSRIVGGINEKSSLAVKEVYQSIVEGEIHITTSTTAEMCKLMENTFRDVNIALANELAKMSEELGVNAWEVIRLANCHPRVNILSPGPGVGGHCIALDPWFLVEKSANAKLIHQGRLNNDSMPEFVKDKISGIIGGLSGKSVAVYGVTYKPNIDDVRESPVMHLIDLLKNAGASVSVCDPHAAEKVAGNAGIYEAAKGCDMLVLGVNHNEFKDVDFAKLTADMKQKNVLDTRNFWNKEDVEAGGAKYYLLGDGNR
ncbi:MAG: nucleotide sugar dehydrogenase [Firmicutes bacterium]|nr:nucleotide sugar dehydrogenase [Bacillota bacterium]